jgi:hypothetical protein
MRLVTSKQEGVLAGNENPVWALDKGSGAIEPISTRFDKGLQAPSIDRDPERAQT